MNVNPFSYLIEKLKGKVDKSGDTMSGTLKIDQRNGTISTEGYSYIHLGNSTPTGTDKNSTGSIRLFASSGKYTNIVAGNLTANRAIAFPDNGGTVALTSDFNKNKMASATDISSYSTYANKYTFPSDGYLSLDVGSGQSGYTYIYGSNSGYAIAIGKSQGSYSLFVREGMKCYTTGSINSVYFLPLS